MIALSTFGDIEVEVTGDQVKRTSPKSKIRTLQRDGRGMASEELVLRWGLNGCECIFKGKRLYLLFRRDSN